MESNNRALSKELSRTSRVRRYVEASKAENTRRAYESHLRDFRDFCSLHHYQSLPAQPAAVIDYLTYLADIGASMSTIQVKASSISYAHRTAKLGNPIKTIEVQETLRGIRRTIGLSQKGKEPLGIVKIRQLLSVLPEDTRGIRDKAILLVGFGGAFRRSELTALTMMDITHEHTQTIIHIRHSKTDQEGRGMTKIIPVLKDKTICPVSALKDWVAHAGITEGVIFRPITKGGRIINRIMNPQEVARVIKKYARLADLDVDSYSGHSLRAGYVTEAADHDQPLWKIKKQTGHKSDLVLQRYIRDQGRGATDATRSAFGE